MSQILKAGRKLGWRIEVVRIFDRYGFIAYSLDHPDIYIPSTETYDDVDEAVKHGFDAVYDDRPSSKKTMSRDAVIRRRKLLGKNN